MSILHHCVLHDCLARLLSVCWPGARSAWDNHAFACNFAKYSLIKKFTCRLSNKPFLFWLLRTPPYLKYAATLPCNFSSMACFADINVSQGSVITYVRCGGILTANLPENLPVKKICKSVEIWQNYDHESVAPFFGPPCMYAIIQTRWGDVLVYSGVLFFRTELSRLLSSLSTLGALSAPPDCTVLIGSGWHTSPSVKYTLQLPDFGSRVSLKYTPI